MAGVGIVEADGAEVAAVDLEAELDGEAEERDMRLSLGKHVGRVRKLLHIQNLCIRWKTILSDARRAPLRSFNEPIATP